MTLKAAYNIQVKISELKKIKSSSIYSRNRDIDHVQF